MFSALISLALAADPVDIGVLKEEHIKVVQRQLYTKEGRTELGFHLGVMPFDGYTWAPNAALSGTYHLSEAVGVELKLGGGYGLKTAQYIELEGPAYGVAVEAYRYLGGFEADLQWTPIYAKMNLFGKKVIHHDVYLLGGAGLTVEQSLLPSADMAFAPTIPLGIGARLFLGESSALRAELRDSLLIENRAQSETTALKQNVGVNLGFIMYMGGGS